MNTKRLQTRYVKGFLPPEEATTLYDYLIKTIEWNDGVKSKRTGFTRKAKAIYLQEDEKIDRVVLEAIDNLCIGKYALLGMYLNYYANGDMYTPSHSHPKQHQIVISLGATRKLVVGKKTYEMSNGDVIMFGASTHSVPKQPDITQGRISIATFMMPNNSDQHRSA